MTGEVTGDGSLSHPVTVKKISIQKEKHMKQKINPNGVVKPPAPYTNVIAVDSPEKMIFLSGVSATNEQGELVGQGDILAQTKQIAKNIATELQAVGANVSNVVMTTTYVLGDVMDDFLATGSAGVLFDALDNPADTLIGVASLAGMKYGALIEVNAIAVIN